MLILNWQFWEGDKAQSMALARLVADLEDKPREDVIFLFSARFDSSQDKETIEYVARKFRVLQYTTKRKATGWPHGPNQMMADSYEHCVELWRRNKLPPNIQAVMLIEADCVPLRKGWVDELIAEYKGCGRRFLGAWLKLGDANVEHVNGNCIMSIDFWKKCPAIFHPPSRGGWDAALKYAILPNAAPSKLIWSDYRLGTSDNPWKGDDYLWAPKRYGAPSNPLFGQDLQPCWYHGIKTMQGIEAVRNKLLNEPQNTQN